MGSLVVMVSTAIICAFAVAAIGMFFGGGE